MPESVTEKQQIIDELRASVTGPEDQAYLNQLQKEHDEARASLGLSPNDPALQHIEDTAIRGAMYQVDSAGHVTLGDKPAEDMGAYEKGRQS